MKKAPDKVDQIEVLEQSILAKLINSGVLSIGEIEKLGFKINPDRLDSQSEKQIFTGLIEQRLINLDVLAERGFKTDRSKIAASGLSVTEIMVLEMIGIVSVEDIETLPRHEDGGIIDLEREAIQNMLAVQSARKQLQLEIARLGSN